MASVENLFGNREAIMREVVEANSVITRIEEGEIFNEEECKLLLEAYAHKVHRSDYPKAMLQMALSILDMLIIISDIHEKEKLIPETIH